MALVILNKRAMLRRNARAVTCSSHIRLSWHLPLYDSLASSGLWETQPPHRKTSPSTFAIDSAICGA